MKSLNKTLIATIVAGAALVTVGTAQAWWGGPGWGRHHGNDYWGDGLGDLWGDGDFSMGFSGRARGRGYGRGYGDYYGHRYYRPYWGGYPPYGWGGYPGYGYGAPWGAPPAAQAPQQSQSGDK